MIGSLISGYIHQLEDRILHIEKRVDKLEDQERLPPLPKIEFFPVDDDQIICYTVCMDEDLDFWLRRRTTKNGKKFLVWHSYATKAKRDLWARTYINRGDTVWLNEDGSTTGLFMLKDENAWKPTP